MTIHFLINRDNLGSLNEQTQYLHIETGAKGSHDLISDTTKCALPRKWIEFVRAASQENVLKSLIAMKIYPFFATDVATTLIYSAANNILDLDHYV